MKPLYTPLFNMYELVVVIEITILHLNIKKVNASCRSLYDCNSLDQTNSIKKMLHFNAIEQVFLVEK